MRISSEIKKNRALYFGALAQLFYAIIEFIDSLSIPLIAFGFIPNWYLLFPIANPELASLLATEPFWFIPFFWFFTFFRIVSAIWILQNKAAGFWLAMWISVVTIIAAMFLLPLTIVDMIGTGAVVFLLIMGYFKDQPLIEQNTG